MKMLRTKKVADRLGVTTKTVWNMVQRGSFPNARKVDPKARSIIPIPESDLEQLLMQQNIIKST